MENQHRKIKGYRELTEEEINLMNEIKEKEKELGELVNKMSAMSSLDQYWISIGRTDAQKAFMALVRSVAQPDNTL